MKAVQMPQHAMSDHSFSAKEQIERIRQSLLTPVLVLGGLAGLFATVMGILRLPLLGWSFFVVMSFVGGPLLILLFLLRRRLSYRASVIGLVAIMYESGFVSQWNLGYMGGGAYMLLLVAPALCAVFLGARQAAAMFALGLLTSALMAWGWLTGRLTSQFDVGAYMQLPQGWISYLVLNGLFAAFLVLSLILLWSKLQEAWAHMQHLNDELAHRAAVDRMTGAWNRGHFMDLAEQALRQAERSGQPLAVLMLDLDHFKDINDSHGHATGDEVIKALAHIAQAALRKSDFLGRMGGEEFAIVLPDTPQESALLVAERIRQQVESFRLVRLGVPDVHMTVSIGLAMNLTSSLDQVLAHADAALYRAKNKGRNQVVIWIPEELRFGRDG